MAIFFGHQLTPPSELTQDLDAIGEFPPNWNGYGAPPFTKGHIDMAKMVVAMLSQAPDVLPTGRKSIQLEYRNDQGYYLELELFEDGRIEGLFLEEDQ